VAQTLLYVTRHGETDFNLAGRYCGSTDAPLAQTGVLQAHALAGRLRGVAFDAAVSSPMLRSRQTADIVCGALGIQYSVCARFAERNLGVYEGLTRDEARERYPDLWKRQCTGKPDDAPDNGETIRQACARIDEGLHWLRGAYQNKRVLLICHGFAARAVNRCCKNLSFDEMAGFSLGNCEVAEYTL